MNEADTWRNLVLPKLQSAGLHLTVPDLLKVRAISEHGNVHEFIGKFGRVDEHDTAVNRLRSPLYAA